MNNNNLILYSAANHKDAHFKVNGQQTFHWYQGFCVFCLFRTFVRIKQLKTDDNALMERDSFINTTIFNIQREVVLRKY